MKSRSKATCAGLVTVAVGAAAVAAVLAMSNRSSAPPITKVGYACACANQSAAPTSTTVAYPTMVSGPTSVPDSTAAADSRQAKAQAQAMVDALTLPAGSQSVPAPGGTDFSAAMQSPACTPLVYDTRFWIVPLTVVQTWHYIQSHAPSWIPFTMGAEPPSYAPPLPNGQAYPSSNYPIEFGEAGIPNRPGYSGDDELDVSIASTPDGRTAVRADGEAAPADATCTSSGGGTVAIPIGSSQTGSVGTAAAENTSR